MKENNYTNRFNLRTLFVVLGVVCLLISSCGIKAGIKSFIPASTAETVPFQNNNGNRTFHQQSFVSSACDSIVAHTTDTFSFVQKQLLNPFNGLLFAAFLTLLLGTFIRKSPKLHPLYNGAKIPANLPLFLQCRRLLI